MEAKKELALEEKRKRKVEAEIVEKKRQILEAKEQVVQDFKASKELEDIKIDFAQEAFIRDFELCQRNVAEKFSKLDLNFLAGDSSNEEAEPSIAGADFPTTKPSAAISKAAHELEITDDALTSSFTAPPLEVGDF